jgi:hypothetical protein
MPEPAINALSIDLSRQSAPLLGVGLQLGLERCEFGERRIWIRGFLSLAAIEPRWSRLGPFALALTLWTLATVLAIVLPVVLAILLAMFAAMPAMVARRPFRFGWR